jgi:hypothetical protein
MRRDKRRPERLVEHEDRNDPDFLVDETSYERTVVGLMSRASAGGRGIEHGCMILSLSEDDA